MEVDVPLSEHEQRLLEQIERALVDDDPKFASTVRSGDRRLKARRKLQLGIVLVVVGLAVLVGGAVAQSWLLGVFGFLVMFVGGAPRPGGGAVRLLRFLGGVRGRADPRRPELQERPRPPGGRLPPRRRRPP